jgi:hypothetical protein
MLVDLLVAVIVMGLLYYIVTILPLPQPFKTIAIVIILVICIIWLLSFTSFGGNYFHHSRLG